MSSREAWRMRARRRRSCACGTRWAAARARRLPREALWSACGKGRIPDGYIRLPAAATRALAPARRLHKICKGRRLSVHSVSADAHLARALEWVAAQRAAGRTLNATGGRPRSELAAELQAALRIDKEGARGLVTKLKRKRGAVTVCTQT